MLTDLSLGRLKIEDAKPIFVFDAGAERPGPPDAAR
jgi:hypothetical protein